jgi:protein-tyrosine phosphatase
MNLSQILPQLFVGSCPTSTDDVSRLKIDHAITAILNLQTDQDCDSYDLDSDRIEACCRESAIEVWRIPVGDSDGVDLRENLSQCVEALDELLRCGHTVYVHCTLGTGRSPTVVIAYLVWRQGWTLNDAIEHVVKCHPCSPHVGMLMLVDVDRAAA